MPRFWLSMNPWPLAGSQAWPRSTAWPSRRMAPHDGFFGARLGGPALLVGGQAQIAAGN